MHTKGLLSNFSAEKYSLVGEDTIASSQLALLKVFRPEDWPHLVDLVDVVQAAPEAPKSKSMTFKNASGLEHHLKTNSGRVRLRYISIHQKNSWASLELSQSMLESIVRTYDIMPEFLGTVHCFQDKTCNVEQAFGGSSWKKCAQERKEVAFVLKYPEHNGRSDGADPWSMRQTAVYQSFDTTTNTSLWILLNPKPGAAADDRIRRLLNSTTIDVALEREQPLIVGLLVLSTYFSNWRTYMAYYEKEELRTSNVVISAIMSEELQFSHSTLSSLRRLESRLLLVPPLIHSTTQSIQMLEAFNKSLQASGIMSDDAYRVTQETLHNYTMTAESYLQNASFLLQKTRGTAQLLTDTMNLKHQQNAHSISQNTLVLTNATVQDSAIIRVITFVTMLYLPASFVATLFGMQLFTTNSTGKLMVASSQLWIFFALAASLTAATFGYWKWMDRKVKLKVDTYRAETDAAIEV